MFISFYLKAAKKPHGTITCWTWTLNGFTAKLHICSFKKWHFVNKLFAAHFIFPPSGLCGMFECTLRCLYHALCVRWRKSSREGDIISGCRRRAGNHSSRQEPRQGEEEESLCNWRSDVMVVFTLCLSGLRSWYLSYIRTQLPQHTRGPKLAHTRQQWSCSCSTCFFKVPHLWHHNGHSDPQAKYN